MTKYGRGPITPDRKAAAEGIAGNDGQQQYGLA